MSLPRSASLSAAAVAACLVAAARAQPVIWDEFTQGDLSNDRFHPTPLAPPLGESQLVGSLDGDTGTGIDRDYYSITIPQGQVLSQLVLEQYFSDDPVSFIAIQPGPVFPNDPATVNPGDLMGWMHFGPEDVGLDLLPLMGANGQGFTPPLGAGVYTFWAQQTGEPTTYLLDFVVTVPGPSGAAVLGATPLLMRGRRRRRRVEGL